MQNVYAITTNTPGYLPTDTSARMVALGEQSAAETMRDAVDAIMDDSVEAGTMTDDEASSDLAAISGAIADGDLQYRMSRDKGATWNLPDLDLVVCATLVDPADLDADEREYLEIPVDVPAGRFDEVEGAALAYLNDSDYVTTWALDVKVGTYDPAHAVVTATDLQHPSNVLTLTICGTDVESAD